ncbi:GNAT family N-acetyltransferase [Halobacillus litoralis]|uniref:GNAT family N-acetyltransferase n=1 Tax=Halobacillus litoralis TaxID=45668 RepID=A0A410MA05_9BACI|nr:GNAT family N-acetyltransferase [Halobacillus litoralis]QAS51508.1 GNAT family N-acetyltransferase [Halobacillus litoralis]
MIHLQKVRTDEAAKLHNLMQFYIYEFSNYLPDIKLEDNGAYKPFDLEKYWNNNQFHAYFIKLGDELIGFALIESATFSNPNTVEEYFIITKYKGKGYGKVIAKKLFTLFPGEWEITQIENNEPAHAFWKGLIHEVSDGNFREHFKDGVYVQKFNT